MGRYIVNGMKRLEGEITVQGSKNASLPIMAASLLCGGQTVLHNIANIEDVKIMKQILSTLGCKIRCENNSLIIDSSCLSSNVVSDKLVSKMRSSVMLMGALLAKNKYSEFSMPGGCEIGLRPIDLHIKGLKSLGAKIREEHGYIIIDGTELSAANVMLNYPSVGATENIMLASVFIKGVTSISNAAKEPEIIDLQNFLNKMGARVYGAGSNTIYIEGVEKLHGCEYDISCDRIVTGTYLCATHLAGGKVFLRNATLENIKSAYYKLVESGLKIKSFSNGVLAESDGVVQAIDSIVTQPYPGFPTDLQPLFTAMLTKAKGTSIINETVFENRYKFTSQLARMGANIKIEGRIAIVNGVEKLSGATVYSQDLRGGASLVLAALASQGRSVIEDTIHIERGYDNFVSTLKSIGADIKSMN